MKGTEDRKEEGVRRKGRKGWRRKWRRRQTSK